MSELQVGFSRQDMTPVHGAPLGGYGNGNQRIGENVLHPITVTCVAYKDFEGELALMFSQDLCGTNGTHTAAFKTLLNEKFNIKKQNIFFSATHSHCAPSESMSQKHPLMIEWNEKFYYPAVMKAAEEAINDLDESEIFVGRTVVEGMNFVRRFVDAEGKFVAKTKAAETPGARHESEPDKDMQVIRFKRKNNKDIVMVNFQVHPSGFFDGLHKTDISSDYPHFIRTVLEEKLNVHCVYFQGACGNLVFTGRFPGEISFKDKDKLESCKWYGTELANYAEKALNNTKELKAGKIRTAQTDVTLTVDHSMDDRVPEAKEVFDLFLQDKASEASALAKQKGFRTYYQCRDIVKRASLPATKDIAVWAMNIGELGFGFAPYEMFDTNGMEVKNASPCKMTFICEQSNNGNSYMPSRIAYATGGYEVESCKYIAGTGEQLAQGIIDALNENAKNI